jgi:uncharacterized pyridoxal phosphate-containing UPF0001 family protein
MDSVDNFYHIKNQLNTNFNNTKIIVVTKSFNLEKINPLLRIGHLHFGENRIHFFPEADFPGA